MKELHVERKAIAFLKRRIVFMDQTQKFVAKKGDRDHQVFYRIKRRVNNVHMLCEM